MPHSSGLSSRALVTPNREVLRALRDRYLREMEARSYDEVKNKFLEELQAKSGSAAPKGTPSALQRERGAGIWNKAFASASKSRMLRSSIIQLAEFFGVEPEELILAEERDAPSPAPPREESFNRQPARRTRSRGDPRGPSLAIGTISSNGGTLRTGSISQRVFVGRSLILNLESSDDSFEEAADRTEILFLAVAPVSSEAPHPRASEEMRVIQGALKESELGTLFSLRQRTAARTQELGQALLWARPQIVHLSGAGDPRGLSLKELEGPAHPAVAEVLAAFFKALRGAVECVVLSGCYAEPQAQAILRYVPYVIGVKPQAGTESTLAFMKRFYLALGEGLPIAKAFGQAVAQSQREGRFEHSLPVLLQQR